MTAARHRAAAGTAAAPAAGPPVRRYDPDRKARIVEAAIGVIAGADPRDWAVAYELYLAALRDPALRDITESWMRTSRAVLERFVDPVTARGVDGLIEGLVMHKTLSTAGVSRDQTRDIIGRLIPSSE